MQQSKKLALHWKIIIGLTLGVAWAIFASFLKLSAFTIQWIDPFGEIFIRLLKLIAVPLVLFSIIDGIANMGSPALLRKLGAKTLSLYLITTILAISTGLGLANLIQPGTFINQETLESNRIKYELWAKENQIEIKDQKCLSCLDENSKQILAIQEQLKIESSSNENFLQQIETEQNSSGQQGPLQLIVEMVPENIFFSVSNNGRMLQVIVFALFFGVSLTLIPNEKSAPIIQLVGSIHAVFIKMVHIIMTGAPYFVFALLAGTISKIAGDEPKKVVDVFKGLGMYSLTVLLGLGLLLFVFYPFITKTITRKIGYRDFFKALSPAHSLAFSTSSSAATLPVTFECVENNLKVDQQVSSFVLPIGATVNMDGTSLYQAVVVIFVAQFHLIDLSLAQQLTIILTTTLASIGTAAVPSAGIVMLIIVFQSVGLNPAWIAIIFPVDRFLDMCRTVVNITGDSMVAVLVAHSEKLLHYRTKNSS